MIQLTSFIVKMIVDSHTSEFFSGLWTKIWTLIPANPSLAPKSNKDREYNFGLLLTRLLSTSS